MYRSNPHSSLRTVEAGVTVWSWASLSCVARDRRSWSVSTCNYKSTRRRQWEETTRTSPSDEAVASRLIDASRCRRSITSSSGCSRRPTSSRSATSTSSSRRPGLPRSRPTAPRLPRHRSSRRPSSKNRLPPTPRPDHASSDVAPLTRHSRNCRRPVTSIVAGNPASGQSINQTNNF